MRKTFILILTHGTWGKELIKSTEMVLGKINDAKAISFMPDVESEVYIENIKQIMKEHSSYDFLILVDIIGGTPYNIGSYFVLKQQAEAVSGLSMDLLITALDLREHLPCSNLSDRLLQTFRENDWYVADLKKFLSDESNSNN